MTEDVTSHIKEKKDDRVDLVDIVVFYQAV